MIRYALVIVPSLIAATNLAGLGDAAQLAVSGRTVAASPSYPSSGFPSVVGTGQAVGQQAVRAARYVPSPRAAERASEVGRFAGEVDEATELVRKALEGLDEHIKTLEDNRISYLNENRDLLRLAKELDEENLLEKVDNEGFSLALRYGKHRGPLAQRIVEHQVGDNLTKEELDARVSALQLRLYNAYGQVRQEELRQILDAPYTRESAELNTGLLRRWKRQRQHLIEQMKDIEAFSSEARWLGFFDINDLSVKELETIPGIGRVLAERIASTTINKPEDLRSIKGIGAQRAKDLESFFEDVDAIGSSMNLFDLRPMRAQVERIEDAIYGGGLIEHNPLYGVTLAQYEETLAKYPNRPGFAGKKEQLERLSSQLYYATPVPSSTYRFPLVDWIYDGEFQRIPPTSPEFAATLRNAAKGQIDEAIEATFGTERANTGRLHDLIQAKLLDALKPLSPLSAPQSKTNL